MVKVKASFFDNFDLFVIKAPDSIFPYTKFNVKMRIK